MINVFHIHPTKLRYQRYAGPRVSLFTKCNIFNIKLSVTFSSNQRRCEINNPGRFDVIFTSFASSINRYSSTVQIGLYIASSLQSCHRNVVLIKEIIYRFISMRIILHIILYCLSCHFVKKNELIKKRI